MPQVKLELDDELRRVLEARAAAAGVSLDVYVRESVLMRLMIDMAQTGDSALENRMQHVREKVEEPAPEDSVAAAVRDPRRLAALEASGLLQSPAEPSFDRLVRLAAEALAAPVAAVSLWPKTSRSSKARSA